MEGLTIAEVRSKVTSDARQVLDTVWKYYVETRKGMPAYDLHIQYGNMANAQKRVGELNGSLIWLNESQGRLYELPPLGVLCTTEGETLEQALGVYLVWLKQKLKDEPGLTTIDRWTVSQVLNEVGISSTIVPSFARLVFLNSQFQQGGNPDDQWAVTGMGERLFATEDVPKYMADTVLRQYDPGLPISLNEQQTYLYRRQIADQGLKQATTDLDFVKVAVLRAQLIEDWREIQLTHPNGAHKATLILAGCLLEGLLLDQLLKLPLNEVAAAWKFAHPHSKGTIGDLDNLGLPPMIRIAEQLKILTKESGLINLGNAVQDFRDLIHPGRQMRGHVVVSKRQADIAFSAADLYISHFRGAAGLTARP